MSNLDDLEKQKAHEVDYRESVDVTHVHAAIEREKKEPWTADVPVPLWLMVVFALVLGWGCYYLGNFNGGYSGSVYNETEGMAATSAKKGAAGQAAGAAAETPVEEGKKLFAQNCQVCHQPTGMGVPGQYPPLAKSEFVNGGSKRVEMILLKGLQGPIKVNGVQFGAAAMPAWEKTMTDKKIAAILTYIRQEWGNTAGPVAPEQVGAIRKEFKDHADSWTEADILAVPADAGNEAAAPAASAAPAAPAASPAAGK